MNHPETNQPTLDQLCPWCAKPPEVHSKNNLGIRYLGCPTRSCMGRNLGFIIDHLWNTRVLVASAARIGPHVFESALDAKGNVCQFCPFSKDHHIHVPVAAPVVDHQVIYADGFCARCSELAYPLTRALEKTGVPTGEANWQQTYGPNKVRALDGLETCLRRLLNALEEGKPEEIKSRIGWAKFYIEFHAEVRRRLTALAQETHHAAAASSIVPAGRVVNINTHGEPTRTRLQEIKTSVDNGYELEYRELGWSKALQSALRDLYFLLTFFRDDLSNAVAPVEKSPAEREEWCRGMRDAAKEVCDACSDEYRYGHARKIEGSTRWWHGEHADFQCKAGSIWHALADTEPLLTEEESQFIIGAMPSQSLPSDVELAAQRMRDKKAATTVTDNQAELDEEKLSGYPTTGDC